MVSYAVGHNMLKVKDSRILLCGNYSRKQETVNLCTDISFHISPGLVVDETNLFSSPSSDSIFNPFEWCHLK